MYGKIRDDNVLNYLTAFYEIFMAGAESIFLFGIKIKRLCALKDNLFRLLLFIYTCSYVRFYSASSFFSPFKTFIFKL